VKLVVDMNLGPDRIGFLGSHGHDAVHWSAVGDVRARDEQIVAWARQNSAVVLTADLDFAAILALTGATGPSVVLLRVQDTFPDAVGDMVVVELGAHRTEIETGAIVTIDGAAGRVRILPIQRR
jgi:predicted nuclease of predicted toxin-antitoxin system